MADIPLSEGYNTKLRRETIKRLILSEAIGTQNELTEKLKAAGFPTTQSTVSRDIRELHLVKISGKNGKYYAVSDAADERFERLYRTVVKKAVKAMNIVVIRTTVGMAQGLCVYLDRMPFDGIAGTLAGDDTILMIMESEETASALMGVLPQM